MINYRLKINFQDAKTLTSDICFVSGDINSNTLIFEFYDEGKRVDISNYTLSVRAKRSDGVVIASAGTIKDNTAIFTPENNFYAVPGELYMEIALSDSVGRYATTKIIVASVVQGLGEAAVDGADNLSVYVTLLNEAQNKINQANELIKKGAVVGRSGKGEKSEIFNDYTTNNAYGDYSHAEGYSTSAGMMGFYYYSIAFGEDSDTITLTDKQNELTDKDFSEILAKYPEGAVISIINNAKDNNSKFINCSKILSIDGNVVTVEKLPFNSVEMIKEPAMNDYTFWVESMPDVGVVSLGWYSHSEGENTRAGERAAHSEGRETFAYGQYSHAEGSKTLAGHTAHAEGGSTKATGSMAHAEGFDTEASGTYGAHSEGMYTVASGSYGSHAEGKNTKASGDFGSHAEGYYTEAEGLYGAHAEGMYTVAASNVQHVQGKYNVIDKNNTYAHIVGGGDAEDEYDEDGNLVKRNRKNIHTLDWHGNATFEGRITSKGDIYVGDEKVATEKKLVEEIDKIVVLNHNNSNLKNGSAKGSLKSTGSETEGTKPIGEDSIALGCQVKAPGLRAFAEGDGTTASGSYGVHAEGRETVASGSYGCHAEGFGTIAASNTQHVEGRYNVKDTAHKYVHITGGGESDTKRKNIHTIDWSGNAMFEGSVKCCAVILTSPSGKQFKLTVDDNGSLITEAL